MLLAQTRSPARRFAVDQPSRPRSVELDDPITNDLERNPGDLGGLRPARPVIDRSHRQQSPRLRAAPALPGQSAHADSVKIVPKRNSHGETPSFATLNQTLTGLESSPQVTFCETWYYTKLQRERFGA